MGEALKAGMFTPLAPWVEEIVTHCGSTYVGEHGLLVTSLDGNGRVLDAEPLIADYGDVLPFLWYFGAREFVTDQLRCAQCYLKEGLYQQDGQVRLFSNHDWLLGLLSLYRLERNEQILSLAQTGARAIAEKFFRGGVLIDALPDHDSWRTWLQPASPFNGGFVELWIELYELTGQAHYLAWAQRLARGWTRSAEFIKFGVFARKLSARSRVLDFLLRKLATLKARLFKDNTNLVWGLIALDRVTGAPEWRTAIRRWLDGFEAYFFNDGNAHLNIDRYLRGYEPSLKAAFSSIDLFSDLWLTGIEPDRAMDLARRVASFWLPLQWENGLFPEQPGVPRSHLDANVDLVVALTKLSGIAHQREYQVAASKCTAALLKLHRTDRGYGLAVDPHGRIVDARIIVKYQSLLTKLALLPKEAALLQTDAVRLDLLRDR